MVDKFFEDFKWFDCGLSLLIIHLILNVFEICCQILNNFFKERKETRKIAESAVKKIKK